MNTTETTQPTIYDLKQRVSQWVDREFNFIQLDNFQTVLKANDFELYDIIRQKDWLFEFWLENMHGQMLTEFVQHFDSFAETDVNNTFECFQNFQDDFWEFIEQNYPHEYESFQNDRQHQNYPMWGTIFEFRHEPPEELIEACVNAGFGVIESCEHYNTSLFVSGAGYSFYGAHWIPAYLEYYDRDGKYSHITKEEISAE